MSRWRHSKKGAVGSPLRHSTAAGLLSPSSEDGIGLRAGTTASIESRPRTYTNWTLIVARSLCCLLTSSSFWCSCCRSPVFCPAIRRHQRSGITRRLRSMRKPFTLIPSRRSLRLPPCFRHHLCKMSSGNMQNYYRGQRLKTQDSYKFAFPLQTVRLERAHSYYAVG